MYPLPQRSRPPCPEPGDAIGPESRPVFARHVLCGRKPREAWTVGPELELFGYERATLERIRPETVDAVLAAFESDGTRTVSEDGRRIEVAMPWGWVTVEPGGQIEFSGANRAALAEVERDARRFVDRLAAVAGELDVLFVASGFDPLRSAGEQRWYPKRRYAVMRPYFAVDGRRGWDMMCRTGAIQANVDYGSEADLAAKFLVGNRLGPVAAAMFANSPLEAGALSGFKSRRYAAWLETDRDRTGVSPASLDAEFTVDAFVEYALRVPMLFVRRDGRYVDLAGHSFERFLAEGAAGEMPRFQDFADHLTTIFTEARLKQHIELRSADAGGVEELLAVLAFWKGIAYDAAALDGALALAPRLDAGGFRRLQAEVARRGLGAESEGVRVADVAREAVALAADGLSRVAPDEASYLAPLAERVGEGFCPADRVIRDFEGRWDRDPRRALAAMRIA
jgi:glutamate--cysteine ligase